MLTLGFSLCEFVYRLLRAVIVGTFSASLWLPMLVALVASTVAGYFALQYLKYLLHREKLRVFSYYCWDDTCIAIRMAVKAKGKVYVQAGGGIVADSVPEKEYEESANKAKAVIHAIEAASEVND